MNHETIHHHISIVKEGKINFLSYSDIYNILTYGGVVESEIRKKCLTVLLAQEWINGAKSWREFTHQNKYGSNE